MTREGSALGTIAKRVGVEGPTFVRMIAQFEREGLVKRLSSDEDRRASIIKITAKGESVLAEMRELTSKARKDFLGDIYSPGSLAFVRDVKRAVDPNNRFGAGNHGVGVEQES